jgi:hypothetical protein
VSKDKGDSGKRTLISSYVNKLCTDTQKKKQKKRRMMKGRKGGREEGRDRWKRKKKLRLACHR